MVAPLLLGLLPGLLAAQGCGSPAGDPPAPAGRSVDVVVASFNFDESVLLAEIYAQSLEAAGLNVGRELALGPRELVLPALQQGFVDLVPEYLGSSLVGLDAGAGVDLQDRSAVQQALEAAAEPWGLEVLAPARAQNRNVLAVTRAFAERRDVEAISDLRPLVTGLRLGGPAECPERPFCLPGLESVYGLDFRTFVAVEGSARALRALEEDVIDVAVLFSTDGPLAEPTLVALDDDRGLGPAENVVPLVRSEVVQRHGQQVRATLGEVSSRLTTPMLRFPNWRVTVAGNDPADEARGWLLRQGLIPG
jgi:osmoprotectant transport system substrate-binding protein